jgi:hypothetical protein
MSIFILIKNAYTPNYSYKKCPLSNLQFKTDEGYSFVAKICSLVLDEYMLFWLTETFIAFIKKQGCAILESSYNKIKQK